MVSVDKNDHSKPDKTCGHGGIVSEKLSTHPLIWTVEQVFAGERLVSVQCGQLISAVSAHALALQKLAEGCLPGSKHEQNATEMSFIPFMIIWPTGMTSSWDYRPQHARFSPCCRNQGTQETACSHEDGGMEGGVWKQRSSLHQNTGTTLSARQQRIKLYCLHVVWRVSWWKAFHAPAAQILSADPGRITTEPICVR